MFGRELCSLENKGLAICWTNDLDLQIINYSSYHISTSNMDSSNSVPWTFTGFYSDPELKNRLKTWKLLQHLLVSQGDKILVSSDFNEITTPSEKLG